MRLEQIMPWSPITPIRPGKTERDTRRERPPRDPRDAAVTEGHPAAPAPGRAGYETPSDDHTLDIRV